MGQRFLEQVGIFELVLENFFRQPLCFTGVSSMTAEHGEMLKALKVKTPSQSQQLSLL